MGRLLRFPTRGAPPRDPPVLGPELPSDGRTSLLSRSEAPDGWEVLLEEERRKARIAWTVARLSILAALLVLAAWLLG